MVAVKDYGLTVSCLGVIIGFYFINAALREEFERYGSQSVLGCLWVLLGSRLNMIVALNGILSTLFILFRVVTSGVFGTLTERENGILSSKMNNFALYKFVFMGVIIDSDSLELGVWILWFAAILFLKVLQRLSLERYTMVSVWFYVVMLLQTDSSLPLNLTQNNLFSTPPFCNVTNRACRTCRSIEDLSSPTLPSRAAYLLRTWHSCPFYWVCFRHQSALGHFPYFSSIACPSC